MSSNKIFKRYSSLIRLTMHCHKEAPKLLKLWSRFHPNNRKEFPTNTVDAVKRSKKIYKDILNKQSKQ